LDGTLHTDSNQTLLLHSHLSQMVSRLVGSRIEFGVGESMVAEYQSDGIRRSLDLSLKELMDAAMLRVISFCVVPFNQQLIRPRSINHLHYRMRWLRVVDMDSSRFS